MKIAIISASPRKEGYTHFLMREIQKLCEENEVNYLDLSKQLTPFGQEPSKETTNATQALYDADVWFIGTPVYNAAMTSALKNLFEWCDYKKTEGKKVGLVILASGEQTFVYVQGMLTTLMNYFKVHTNPRAVFANKSQMDEAGKITDEKLLERLKELVNSTIKMK